jgi:hypothetical protein
LPAHGQHYCNLLRGVHRISKKGVLAEAVWSGGKRQCVYIRLASFSH